MNKLILFLLCLVALSSCRRILISIITDKSIDPNVKILKNAETGRVLYFIPMVHIGKAEYYESAKKIIDSLHQEGFIAYFEGIEYNEGLDSLTRDTLDRKVRKLLGFHFSSSYKDEENKSLPRAIRKNKYEMQDYDKMGILATDRKADLSLDSLIRRYEKEIKPIQLLPCDFETPLLDKYKCKDKEKYSDFDLIHTFREDHLISEVLKSEHKKIILVYGRAHWVFLYGSFQQNGFCLVQGKKQLFTFP